MYGYQVLRKHGCQYPLMEEGGADASHDLVPWSCIEELLGEVATSFHHEASDAEALVDV